MSFLPALAAHAAALPPLRPFTDHLLALLPHGHAHTAPGLFLADGTKGTKFDNPPPQAPPGLAEIAKKWLGWLKWLSGIAGIVGLMFSGIMMAIGRRNRSYLAGEGAAGIPWVFGGLLVVSLATQIVESVLT